MSGWLRSPKLDAVDDSSVTYEERCDRVQQLASESCSHWKLWLEQRSNKSNDLERWGELLQVRQTGSEEFSQVRRTLLTTCNRLLFFVALIVFFSLIAIEIELGNNSSLATYWNFASIHRFQDHSRPVGDQVANQRGFAIFQYAVFSVACLVGILVAVWVGLKWQSRFRWAQAILERLPLLGALVAETRWRAWFRVRGWLLRQQVETHQAALMAATATLSSWDLKHFQSETTMSLRNESHFSLPIGVAAWCVGETSANLQAAIMIEEAWSFDFYSRLQNRSRLMLSWLVMFFVQTLLLVFQVELDRLVAAVSPSVGMVSNSKFVPEILSGSVYGTLVFGFGVILFMVVGPRRFSETHRFCPSAEKSHWFSPPSRVDRSLLTMSWAILIFGFLSRCGNTAVSFLLMSAFALVILVLYRDFSRLERISRLIRIAASLDSQLALDHAVNVALAGSTGSWAWVHLRLKRDSLKGRLWWSSLLRRGVLGSQNEVAALRMGVLNRCALSAVTAAFKTSARYEFAGVAAAELQKSIVITLVVGWALAIASFSFYFVGPSIDGVLEEFRDPAASHSGNDQEWVVSGVDQSAALDADRDNSEQNGRQASSSSVRLMFLGFSLILLAVLVTFLLFVLLRLSQLPSWISNKWQGARIDPTLILRWLVMLRRSGASWSNSLLTVEQVVGASQFLKLEELRKSLVSLGNQIAVDAKVDAPVSESETTANEVNVGMEGGSVALWNQAGLLRNAELSLGAEVGIDTPLLHDITELRELQAAERWKAILFGYRCLIIGLIIPIGFITYWMTFRGLLVFIDLSLNY